MPRGVTDGRRAATSPDGSIAAAVALSKHMWVLILGGLLGILAMRFAAQGFVKLLELLSRAKTTLHELAERIPDFFLVKRTVQCPWELKGTVMRVMTKECRDSGKVELIDGIKVYQNGRWALILPDAAEPSFHLYAEAESPEAAEILLTQYLQRIEQMKERGTA